MQTWYPADNRPRSLSDPIVRGKGESIHHEIVEISSDEEDGAGNGQPESSRRPVKLSPSTKRIVDIDNDVDDLAEFGMYFQLLEPTRTKRQKFEHTLNSHKPFTNNIDAAHNIESEDIDLTEYTNIGTSPPLSKANILSSVNEHDDGSTKPTHSPVPYPTITKEPVQATGPGQLTNPDNPKYVAALDHEMKLEVPPYYDDPKLEARMYRGPGYERFPIVLGTIPGHQDACDEWDRRQAKISIRLEHTKACQPEFAHLRHDTMEFESSQHREGNLIADMDEVEYIDKIREVLPDVQREFALQTVRDYMKNLGYSHDDEIQIRPNLAAIVSRILELSDYPRQDTTATMDKPAEDGTGVTIPWQKGDAESKTYQRDAICLLASQFDRVPTYFIFGVVQEKKSLYESFLHIQDLTMKYDKLSAAERPYRRYHQPRRGLEKKYRPIDPGLRSKEQWDGLVNEMQAAKQQAERNRLREAKQKNEEVAEVANFQEHKASGNLIECQCCFDEEIPINRAVSCEGDEIHWFCFGCVRRLAENQVGSMKHEMSCMHQNGCKANLSRDDVNRAVPVKIADKLAFYQQQYDITAACIDGLEQCPFCDFKAICDPIEIDSVFQCQNPDCERVSCRKCHEASHVPKTCAEVKVDRRLSARHQVEEARSEAMIRACPNCQVKIVKEHGCNKMACTNCGCVMCYVCKKDIANRRDGGYGHFNDPGATCELYDNNFDRHEREADEAEKEAIKRVRAENTDVDEKQLQIDTGDQKIKLRPLRNPIGLDWRGVFDMENIEERQARAQEAFGHAIEDEEHWIGPLRNDFAILGRHAGRAFPEPMAFHGFPPFQHLEYEPMALPPGIPDRMGRQYLNQGGQVHDAVMREAGMPRLPQIPPLKRHPAPTHFQAHRQRKRAPDATMNKNNAHGDQLGVLPQPAHAVDPIPMRGNPATAAKNHRDATPFEYPARHHIDYHEQDYKPRHRGPGRRHIEADMPEQWQDLNIDLNETTVVKNAATGRKPILGELTFKEMIRHTEAERRKDPETFERLRRRAAYNDKTRPPRRIIEIDLPSSE